MIYLFKNSFEEEMYNTYKKYEVKGAIISLKEQLKKAEEEWGIMINDVLHDAESENPPAPDLEDVPIQTTPGTFPRLGPGLRD